MGFYKKRKRKSKSTGIEIKVGTWLKKNNIYFKKEFRIDLFNVDFYVPKKKLVIQVDGCYWHFNPCQCNCNKKPTGRQIAQSLRDKGCTAVMRSKGYKVIRLWECDIDNNWNKCEELLKEFLEE